MSDDYFQMYLDEIGQIAPCSQEEKERLLERVSRGDEAAKNRLAEGFLAYAADLAKAYSCRGLPMGDLVQEANVALVMAVGFWRQGEDFCALLKAQVETALEAAIKKQELEEKAEEEMLARVNVLKEVSRQMAEELGREATVRELSEKMKMTEDEIKAVMKLTLDAMNAGTDAETIY